MPRSLKSYIAYSLGFFIVLELLLAAAILYWPEFVKNFDNIVALTSFLKPVRDLAMLAKEEGVPAYVAGQHFFKGCSAMGTAASVLFAANAIAGEAQRGTLELMLARPVSRLRLYTERWLGGFLAVALPVYATTMTVPWLLSRVGESMDWGDLLLCATYMCLFLAPIFALTFAWSSWGSEPLRISYVSLFAAILAFGLYFVEVTTNLTPFRLVDPRVFMAIIKTDSLDWRRALPLAFVTLLGFLAGDRGFRSRTP